MRRIYLLLFFLLYVLGVKSQTITVFDKTNLQPLIHVEIYSNTPKVSCITNNKGQADFSRFKLVDSVNFHMVGYQKTTLTYKQIEKAKFKVFLSEKSYSLDEVVISSSRFEEKMSDVPQQIEVIKAKEIEQMNQQSTADLMQSSGNVLVQKSQMGGGSPIIRGFEASKVLIVVDGVRMNNAIYRSGHLQNVITIDNSMLEKTEIVFGPGSVVYGSDALGGVMHFYSKRPNLQQEGDSNIVSASAYSRFSTANNEKTEHVDFNIGFKKIAFLTSVTVSDFGDLRQGSVRNPFYGDWGKRSFYVARINGVDSMVQNSDVNIQKRTAYKQRDFSERILIQQSENTYHLLNFQYSTSSDIPRYDRLTEFNSSGMLKSAEWYYGPQNRLFASYSLKLKSVKGFYDEAHLILAYQDIEESRHNRSFGSSKLNHRIENVKVYSLNADFGKNIKEQEIRYGIEGTYNDVNSKANQENIISGISVPLDTRYPSGGSSMQSLSAYLTHSWEISEKLVLSDGLRFTNTTLNANFSDTSFFPFPFSDVTQKSNSLNGKVGLTYKLPLDWRIAILGSTGFRAPNVDDMSKVFESAGGNLIVPNPDLKPEHTYNGELSLSKVFNKRVKTEVIGFYTLYKDAITTDISKFNGNDSIMYAGQMSQVITQVNKNEAYIYGISANLHADVTDAFSISSTVNYTYGRIKTDTVDYPLDHVPPVFGKTSFNLKIKKFRGEFFVMYNGAKTSKNYNLLGEDNQVYSADPINGYTPAWYTLNLRTAWQINKYIQLQIALENILDQNYRSFASGIGAPGRNFIVTLRGKF